MYRKPITIKDYTFRVLSEDDAVVYEETNPHLFISIRSPERDILTLPQNKERIAKLFLEFHDLDHPLSHYEIFTKEHAVEVLSFVNDNQDIKTVIINCEAGISRSAGCAAALAKILCEEDQIFFKKYLPNTLVYRTILECYFNGEF